MVALGIGLLIGAERERRNLERPTRSAAGIRTFAVAALAGALSFIVGEVALLAATTVAVGAFVALGYWRTRQQDDPGLTTEVALLLTVLLGALAVREPALAAAAGVTVAILLAARSPLHRFVSSVLTERELRSALILAAATLVVLPMLPDRPMGPFAALNPRTVWILIILVLAIGAGGHVAVRALGSRFGLPAVGLASGFVSSAATIGAMGARAAKSPAVLPAAAAGAVLSTVATVVQMAAVVAAISLPALGALAPALISAGLAAVGYGVVILLRALREPIEDGTGSGEAFSLATALIFGLTLSVVLIASAALRAWFGEAGSIAAAALAGVVDTHSAAIAVAALVASGDMTAAEAVIPILAAFTTNTLTKLILASTTGSRGFAARVVPGLLLVVVAAWLGGFIALGLA